MACFVRQHSKISMKILKYDKKYREYDKIVEVEAIKTYNNINSNFNDEDN